MGAHDFTTYSEGVNMREAYARAVDEARHEHGSDPYNGTISTTGGCYAVEQRPMTMEEAEGVIREWHERDGEDDRFRGIQKWEACGAIPIAAESGFTKRKVKVSLATEQRGYINETKLLKEIAPLVTLNPGERVVSAKVIEDKSRRRTDAARTDGKVVTRYYIYEGGRRANQPKDGYESMAAARAAAKVWLEKRTSEQTTFYTKGEDITLSVIGETRRESGEPLDVIESKVTHRSLRVEVEIVKQKVHQPPVKGWLFFGWAAS